MPAHGYSDGQGRDVGASPSSSTGPPGLTCRGRRAVQLRDSFPPLLFSSFFFSLFSILSCMPGPSLVYKREGLTPFEGRFFYTLKWAHTYGQVLKSPLPSREQSGLGRTSHAHQRPGTPIPLSIVCNPYCKPNTGLVA
jgi:hypothetical protein